MLAKTTQGGPGWEDLLPSTMFTYHATPGVNPRVAPLPTYRDPPLPMTEMLNSVKKRCLMGTGNYVEIITHMSTAGVYTQVYTHTERLP